MLKASFIRLFSAQKGGGKCIMSWYCFQNMCSVVMSTHFQVHENAPPELLEVEEMERSEEVSTALRWVNEELTEQLQGQTPSNQAHVDQLLR